MVRREMIEPGNESSTLGFFAELRRRRVIRVAVVYAISGWISIEVASTMLPGLKLPGWTVTFVIALVVLGFPIAVIMGWMFDVGHAGIQRTPLAETAEKIRTVAVPPGIDQDGRRTIAVLPFVNMSGDADNEYFSDGIAEEILNLLTKLPQLKVASRTSSFVFKASNVNIPTVARELGVSTVLEGSVRRAGDRVRITGQLIDATSDSHLWSETYDRELKDVFAIQDDIARSIVDALQVTLSPKERRAIQYVATADARAYDFYLRGRKYFYAMGRRDLRHAITLYERAIALDPKYARAYAGIADAYAYLYRYAEASADNAARASEASEQAVRMDPDSAEVQASRGLALSISDQHSEAERHFEAAIVLNPNLFEAYLFYARHCSSQGNFEKAARLYRQAAEVNPTHYEPIKFLAQAYDALGRKDDEMRAHRRAVELIEQHLQMNPDDTRALYLGASSYATLGEKGKAVYWANLALQSGQDEPIVLYNVACTFALLGERERAIDLLEQAVKLGWGYRAWMETDGDMASLRDHDRFKTLLANLR